MSNGLETNQQQHSFVIEPSQEVGYLSVAYIDDKFSSFFGYWRLFPEDVLRCHIFFLLGRSVAGERSLNQHWHIIAFTRPCYR